MKVVATRESVAMGDDVLAPHEATWELPGQLGILGVLAALERDRYLPVVGLSTWVARSPDGAALAVLARRWRTPRLLPGTRDDVVGLMDADGIARLHFEYRAQDDPDAVYDDLCEAQSQPRR
ncbi:hypothetical protein [Streptomyces sp. NPDC021020]|uniref:hypothetical protein n=1 Tax=Streptomyces sp. NPDC021020 TaxID=3365109 RepID=UPI0037AF4762